MPRLSRLFGRKQAGTPTPSPADKPEARKASSPEADALDTPDLDKEDHPALDSLALEQSQTGEAPAGPALARPEQQPEPERPSTPAKPRAAAMPAPAPPTEEPAGERPDPGAQDERRGPGPALIGGKEADLVPVIPDTEVEIQGQDDLDEEEIATAIVEALRGACAVMVSRVEVIRKAQAGTQIVAGLIALVTELDVRYASDWGIVRRNGLEEVLIEVRQAIAEGDRFILESLENGRGGLTADVFLRDLRTIAPADRQRMVTAYVGFLIFVIKVALRQYLRPLQNDQARLRHLSRQLDHLIDGVRETLLARVNALPRLG